MLGPVAAVSAPGLIAGVVSLLQDELLALELRVLIAHPAGGEEERGGAVKREEQGDEEEEEEEEEW